MSARALDSATIAFGLVSIPVKVYSTGLELKAVDAVASEEIALREFVPPSAVDPIFVERTYYLAPDRGAAHAYRLLRDALEEAALVGIASYAMRGKRYVGMLRPFGDGLAMHQLRDPDEIKPWSAVELPRLPKPAAAELALAVRVLGHLRSTTFDATLYKDVVKARVHAAPIEPLDQAAAAASHPSTHRGHPTRAAGARVARVHKARARARAHS